MTKLPHIPLQSRIRHWEADYLKDQARPVITFDAVRLEESRRCRGKSLIGQLCGTPIRAQTLQQRLPSVWSCRGTVEVLELQNQFYLFTFSLENDLDRARRWSPWTVAGKKLMVTNWVLNFDPMKAYIACMLVWVQLPGLPIEL